MGWERRGDKSHYYAAWRSGGRVRKQHLGGFGTPAATAGAYSVATGRSHRARIRQLREPLEKAETLTIGLAKLAKAAADRALRSAGCERVRGHWRVPGRPGRPAANRPPLRESVAPDPPLEEACVEATRAAVTALARLVAGAGPDGEAEAADALRLEIRLTLRPGALPAEQAAAAAAVLAREAARHGERFAADPWAVAWAGRAARRAEKSEAAARRLTELLDRPG